ncbi:hypothetical protein D3C73_1593290 [compost metagenome]
MPTNQRVFRPAFVGGDLPRLGEGRATARRGIRGGSQPDRQYPLQHGKSGSIPGSSDSKSDE